MTFLKNCRLAFPVLWEAEQVNGEGDFKFAATLIFPPDSEAATVAKAAALAAATAKWPKNPQAVLDSLTQDKFSLRVGNKNLDKTGDIRNGFADMLYVVAKNKDRPSTFDQRGVGVVQKDNVIYAGCYVDAIVDFFAMDKPGQGKGLFCSLLGVKKRANGDAFGSTPAKADDFEPIDIEDEESPV